jgi:RNA polymerase sigma-70 factor (ECF subfamily)
MARRDPDNAVGYIAENLFSDGNVERAPAPAAGEQEVVQLFDELRSRLLRYLLGFGLPPQDGEEVVQEVFLSLYQHLQRGGSRQNLRGWIFRVAHNLGLKRRLARTREIEYGMASGEALAAAQPDPAENPEEQLLSSQRRQRLQAVLRALPEQDGASPCARRGCATARSPRFWICRWAR